MSVIAVIATVSPTVSGLIANLTSHRAQAVATETEKNAPQMLTIKPLTVRQVFGTSVSTPEQCRPSPTPAPSQPTRACDIASTTAYELGPEALRVNLINVDSLRNPLTGVETVQMSLTDDSARQFSEFAAGQVGKQVAFVRGATVVWGPKITGPIAGQVFQLTGELTEMQANRVAAMLRDES